MSSRLHRRFLPWVLFHALEFKWFYLSAFLCLYLLQVLQSEIPSRIRMLMDGMGRSGVNSNVVWIFMGLALGVLIFRTLSRLLFFYPARVQQKFLRMELLELLEKVPLTRYKERNQGQVFQNIFDDVNSLRAFVGFGLLQIGNLILAALVFIPKINEADSYLWPAFIPLFASVGLFTVMTMINQKIFKKVMDKKGEVQQFIIESYEAKQTIKNYHREDQFISGFVKISKEELRLFFKSSIGFALSGPYVKLGLGMSLIWAAILVRRAGGAASDLVFFSGFLYLFLEPVMFMSWVAVVTAQGFAAWRRIKELFELLVTPSIEENTLSKEPVIFSSGQMTTKLTFWGKSFDFSFKQGKWSVLVGKTGVGKSTLLTQLATALKLQSHELSMVQQDPYLFNDSVVQNIFLGKSFSDEEWKLAEELIVIFQLDGLASSVKEVMQLEVGENGKRLSGGQLKRVALIRSLMSGASLFLWDDPFSSVDIILEKKILTKIKNHPVWKNSTFIITGHRLTTVRLSDYVIFLDKNEGIMDLGVPEKALKEAHVATFFKEQLVELPLA